VIPAAWIQPDFGLPPGLGALATTRSGGVSEGPWASLNLGTACGDASAAVAENRDRIRAHLPADPCWMNQVHGTRLLHLDDWIPGVEADAAWTDRPGQVCAVLTADCLPVLLADRRGGLVAAVHAGWRGLAAGILERVVETLPGSPDDLLAWIGPAIGPAHYEVDAQVRDAMLDLSRALSACFEPVREGHWLADLPAIAQHRLRSAGISHPASAKLCTASDPTRFFSYRRDGGRSGRQASLIWIQRHV
jgi:YfiH family protein